MKKVFLFLMLCVSVSVYAETDFDFLLMNQEKYFDFESLLNPNHLFAVSDGMSVGNAFLFSMDYHGALFRVRVSDYGTLGMKKDASMTNKLNTFFISFPFGDFFLDIGKKKISRGTGFLKSPADFLMSFSRDYSKDKTRDLRFAEGKWMANVDYYSSIGLWSLAYLPPVNMTNADVRRLFSSDQDERLFFSYQFQLDGADGGIDAVYAVSNKQFAAGTYVSLLPMDTVELHVEASLKKDNTRSLLNVLKIPYVGDQYITDSENLLWRPFIIVGGSYIFPQFTILAEYYYNGAGFDLTEWNNLRDRFQKAADAYSAESSDLNRGNLGVSSAFLSSFESLSLCRHYLMLRGYTGDLDGYSFAFLGIFNLEDFSGRAMLSASYSGWKNLTCRIEASLDFGAQNSEFMLLGEKWAVNLNWEIVL